MLKDVSPRQVFPYYTETIETDDFTNILGFKIFPNPAKQVLNVMLEKDIPNNLQLEIIDKRVIYSQYNAPNPVNLGIM